MHELVVLTPSCPSVLRQAEILKGASVQNYITSIHVYSHETPLNAGCNIQVSVAITWGYNAKTAQPSTPVLCGCIKCMISCLPMLWTAHCISGHELDVKKIK
jgi:hypothetical protein